MVPGAQGRLSVPPIQGQGRDRQAFCVSFNTPGGSRPPGAQGSVGRSGQSPVPRRGLYKAHADSRPFYSPVSSPSPPVQPSFKKTFFIISLLFMFSSWMGSVFCYIAGNRSQSTELGSRLVGENSDSESDKTPFRSFLLSLPAWTSPWPWASFFTLSFSFVKRK